MIDEEGCGVRIVPAAARCGWFGDKPSPVGSKISAVCRAAQQANPYSCRSTHLSVTGSEVEIARLGRFWARSAGFALAFAVFASALLGPTPVWSQSMSTSVLSFAAATTTTTTEGGDDVELRIGVPQSHVGSRVEMELAVTGTALDGSDYALIAADSEQGIVLGGEANSTITLTVQFAPAEPLRLLLRPRADDRISQGVRFLNLRISSYRVVSEGGGIAVLPPALDLTIRDDEPPTVQQIQVGGFGDFACVILNGGSLRCEGDNEDGQATPPDDLGPVVQIGLGISHSCALTVSGRVRCWGDNFRGRATPPGDLGPVAQLAVGEDHSCALTVSREVRCWGADFYDQSSPPADLGPVAQISVGRRYSCALQRDGRVRCWGVGADGSGDRRATPPGDLGPVAQISVGRRYSCALQRDGRVRCWGDNFRGRSTPPDDVVLVAQISVGELHSCARAVSGRVRCWGDNEDGQATPPDDLGPVAQLVVGDEHSCAVTVSGQLRCWGDFIDISSLPAGSVTAIDDSGLCALLTDGSVYCPGRQELIPPELAPGDVVMSVWPRQLQSGERAAIHFTDLRETTGAFTVRIEVFGEGTANVSSYYRLLDSSGRSLEAEEDANFPLVAGNSGNSVLLTGNPPMAWLEALADGRSSLLYVRPLELLSASGPAPSTRMVAQPVELSAGPFLTASADTVTEGAEEVQLSILLPLAHIGLQVEMELAVSGTALAGSDYTLVAADSAQGIVLGGEANSTITLQVESAPDEPLRLLLRSGADDRISQGDRLLNLRISRYRVIPEIGGTVDLPPTLYLTIRDDEPPVVQQIQVGGAGNFACVLLNSGLVRCLGDNANGRATPPADLGPVAQLGAGGFYACALTISGRVRCWGSNFFGQSTPPEDLGPVAQISVGRSHSCALTVSGGVRCWGSDLYRQATPPTDLGPVAEVAVGYDHSCAVTDSGGVRCWGYNFFGQSSRPRDPGPFAQLSLGKYHSCALQRDGRVRCWGGNFSGQSRPPVGLGQVVQLAVGADHSCALTVSGQVRCWGDAVDISSLLPGLVVTAIDASGLCALLTDGSVYCPDHPELVPPELRPGDVAMSVWPRQLRSGERAAIRFTDLREATGAFTVRIEVFGEGTANVSSYYRLLDSSGRSLPLEAEPDGSYRLVGRSPAEPPIAWLEALADGRSSRLYVRPLGLLSASVLAPSIRKGAQPIELIDGLVLAASTDTVTEGAEEVQLSIWLPLADTALPVEMELAVSGTALAGSDYTLVAADPEQVVMLGGEANSTITLQVESAPTGPLRLLLRSGADNRISQGDRLLNLRISRYRVIPEIGGTVDFPPQLYLTIRDDEPPVVQQIQVGGAGNFACVLLNSGLVRCLGDNANGRATPPVDLGPVAQIGVGYFYGCALTISGRVRCWGRNEDGQSSPPDDLAPVVQLGVGNAHSCALTVSGRVRCWGSNENGRSTPPDDLGPVAQLAVGEEYNCAVTVSGRVRCWGRDAFAGRAQPPDDLAPVAEVAVGYFHRCALTVGGGVRCWGFNGSGRATPPGNLEPVVQLSAGQDHSCALAVSGQVRCWGDVPVDISSLLPGLVVAAIDASGLCVLLPEGSVYCPGRPELVPPELRPGDVVMSVWPRQLRPGERAAIRFADLREATGTFTARIEVFGEGEADVGSYYRLLDSNGQPLVAGNSVLLTGNPPMAWLEASGDDRSSLLYVQPIELLLASGSISSIRKVAQPIELIDGLFLAAPIDTVVTEGAEGDAPLWIWLPLAHTGLRVEMELAVSGTALAGLDYTLVAADPEQGVVLGGEATDEITLQVDSAPAEPLRLLLRSGADDRISQGDRLLNLRISRYRVIPERGGTVDLPPTLYLTIRDDEPPVVQQIQVGGFGNFACVLLNSGLVRCRGDNANGRATPPEGLGPVAQLSLSRNHSCALTIRGEVRCWGSDEYGRSMPPPDLGPVAQLAVGGEYNCALTVSGRVRCWGSNSYGETMPPPDLGPVAQLAVGEEYSCALTVSREVRCWGADFYDQSSPPADLGPVAQLAVGEEYSCALTVSGGVRCWGSDDDGRATPPEDLGPVAQIGIGDRHSCARTVSGGVRCWGFNDDGYGDRRATPPGDLGPVTQLSVGTNHSCARTVLGRLRCWGTVVDVSPLSPGSVTAIDASGTCALLAEGSVYCPGRPELVPSELRPGEVVMSVWPRQLRPGERAAIHFANLREATGAFTVRIEVFGEGTANVSSYYRLLDSSGRSLPLEAEPDGSYRLVGRSPAEPPIAWLEALADGRSSLLYVRPLELLSASGPAPSTRMVAQPVELSAGPFLTASTDIVTEGAEEAQLSIWVPLAHTGLQVEMELAVSGTALAGSDYTLVAADPEQGIVLGGEANSTITLQVESAPTGPLRLLLRSGADDRISQGDRLLNLRISRYRVIPEIGGTVDLPPTLYLTIRDDEPPVVQQIQVGGFGNFACVLLNSGLVRCRGGNYSGQSTPPVDLGPVAQLGVGDVHSCALTISGRVRCWGGNYSGQSTPPDDLGRVAQLGVGNAHSCAVTDSGAVRCWGNDRSGQSTPPGDLGPVEQLSVGYNHSCALTVSGEVRCWGSNYSGQSTPPGGLGPVAQLSLGADHSCARTVSGEVRCWGNDRSGKSTPPNDLGAVVQLVVGAEHSCAMTVSGQLRCWGDVVDVSPLSPGSVTAIDASGLCALLSEGSVYCPGRPELVPPELRPGDVVMSVLPQQLEPEQRAAIRFANLRETTGAFTVRIEVFGEGDVDVGSYYRLLDSNGRPLVAEPDGSYLLGGDSNSPQLAGNSLAGNSLEASGDGRGSLLYVRLLELLSASVPAPSIRRVAQSIELIDGLFFTASANIVIEGGGEVQLSIWLPGSHIDSMVELELAVSGTALEGSDYTLVTADPEQGIVLEGQGNSPITLRVESAPTEPLRLLLRPRADDRISQGDQSLILRISRYRVVPEVEGTVALPPALDLIIGDDEPPPVLGPVLESTGGRSICARLNGDSVSCVGAGDEGQILQQVDLGQAVQIGVGESRSCVLMMSAGRLRCWGEQQDFRGYLDLPFPVGAVTAIDVYGKCALLADGSLYCPDDPDSSPPELRPRDVVMSVWPRQLRPGERTAIRFTDLRETAGTSIIGAFTARIEVFGEGDAEVGDYYRLLDRNGVALVAETDGSYRIEGGDGSPLAWLDLLDSETGLPERLYVRPLELLSTTRPIPSIRTAAQAVELSAGPVFTASTNTVTEGAGEVQLSIRLPLAHRGLRVELELAVSGSAMAGSDYTLVAVGLGPGVVFEGEGNSTITLRVESAPTEPLRLRLQPRADDRISQGDRLLNLRISRYVVFSEEDETVDLPPALDLLIRDDDPQLVSQVLGNESGTLICVHLNGGSVRCSASDYFGQLPRELGVVAQLSVGDRHICARTVEGGVRCWGSNNFGQSSVPADLGPVAQIGVGANHSCALTVGGEVRCWGDNEYGRFTPPADLGSVAQLAVGWFHNCALQRDRRVRCWGGDNFGPFFLPPGNLGEVAQIAVGVFHSCALTVGGEVHCWGLDFFSSFFLLPEDLGKVAQIAVGASHSCALTVSGEVRCWGGDEDGSFLPPEDLGEVEQIAVSWVHICALTVEGRVRCWGDNENGRSSPPDDLGRVTQLSADRFYSCALTVDGEEHCWGVLVAERQYSRPEDLGEVAQIARGYGHSCALTVGGEVRCWGADHSGQATVPEDLGEVAEIAVGWTHSCALTVGGEVRCWGDNEDGQAMPPEDLGVVAQLVAGRQHTCGLTVGAEVLCWGEDDDGRSSPPEDLGEVTQIAVGWIHSCALTAGGEVRCWGADEDDSFLSPEYLGEVTQIAAGWMHTCALTAGGRMRCWGDVIDVSTLPPGTVAAIDPSGICALLAEDSLYCPRHLGEFSPEPRPGDVVMSVWPQQLESGQRAAIRFTDLRDTTAAFTARIEVFGEGDADIGSYYRLLDSNGRPLVAEPDGSYLLGGDPNSPNSPQLAGNSLAGNSLEALVAGRSSRLYVRPLELLSASGLAPSIRRVAQPIELLDGLSFDASANIVIEGGEEVQLRIWLPVTHTGLQGELELTVSGTVMGVSDYTLVAADPAQGIVVEGQGNLSIILRVESIPAEPLRLLLRARGDDSISQGDQSLTLRINRYRVVPEVGGTVALPPALDLIIGDDEPPPVLGPVLESTGGRSICARLNGDSVRCVGSGVEGQIPQLVDLGPAVQIGVGESRSCVLMMIAGRLRCWGEQQDFRGSLDLPFPVGAVAAIDVYGKCALLADESLYCPDDPDSSPPELRPRDVVMSVWPRQLRPGERTAIRFTDLRETAGTSIIGAFAARIEVFGEEDAEVGDYYRLLDRNGVALVAETDGSYRIEGDPLPLAWLEVLDSATGLPERLYVRPLELLSATRPIPSIRTAAQAVELSAGPGFTASTNVVTEGAGEVQLSIRLPVAHRGLRVELELTASGTALVGSDYTLVAADSEQGIVLEGEGNSLITLRVESVPTEPLRLRLQPRTDDRISQGDRLLNLRISRYVVISEEEETVDLPPALDLVIRDDDPQLVSQVLGNDNEAVVCAHLTGGSLRCSVSDYFRQLPRDLGEAAQIVEGNRHTCARTVEGRVRCWGSNNFGQSSVPADLGPVAQIGVGANHSCALTVGGEVRCWGDNEYGRFTPPADLGSVAQLAVGWFHSCALQRDRRVRCWGRNDFGQFSLLSPLEDLGEVAQIAVGIFHSCALTVGGEVRCWGLPTSDRTSPPGDLGPVAQIAAGFDHTCALTVGGRVRCWGSNGNPNAPDGRASPPDNLGPVAQIAAGRVHSCALTVGGAVRCWGSDFFGQASPPEDLGRVAQLAVGDLNSCALTVGGRVHCWGLSTGGQSSPPADLGEVAQIARGDDHSCALAVGGEVRCWGANYFGQSSVPEDLGAVTQLAVGGFHTCALTVGGAVRCWGYDVDGQSTPPEDLGVVEQIAAGWLHTCALTVGSEVRCWGSNGGPNAPDGRAMPPDNLGPVAQIAVGLYHSCALTVEGQMRCWGDVIDVSFLPPGTVAAIDSSGICALLEEGSLYCPSHFGVLSPEPRPGDVVMSVWPRQLRRGQRAAVYFTDLWGITDAFTARIEVFGEGTGEIDSQYRLLDHNGMPLVAEEDGSYLITAPGTNLAAGYVEALQGGLEQPLILYIRPLELLSASEPSPSIRRVAQPIGLIDGLFFTASANTVTEGGEEVQLSILLPGAHIGSMVELELAVSGTALTGPDYTLVAADPEQGIVLGGEANSLITLRVESAPTEPLLLRLRTRADDRISQGDRLLTLRISRYQVVEGGGEAVDLPPSLDLIIRDDDPLVVRQLVGHPRMTTICAILSGGEARCWEDDGQLAVPADLGPVVQLAVGRSHSCALTVGGGVRCWGSNFFGQSSPPEDLGSVVQLAGAENHSCALTVGGRVRCWGRNDGGQSSPPADLGSVAQLAVSRGHGCALTVGGMVRCWGDDLFGQSSPPDDLGPAVLLAVGGSHGCALTAVGLVRCWGRDEEGQSSPPEDLGSVVQLAMAENHSCALTVGGRVHCWGRDDSGQSSPPADLGSVVQLAVNRGHGCALTVGGMVRCWGDDLFGQSLPPEGLAPATQIVAGFSSSCALLAEGSVRCWGEGRGEAVPAELRPGDVVMSVRPQHLAIGQRAEIYFADMQETTATSISEGLTARIEVFGEGTADISSHYRLVDNNGMPLVAEEDGSYLLAVRETTPAVAYVEARQGGLEQPLILYIRPLELLSASDSTSSIRLAAQRLELWHPDAVITSLTLRIHGGARQLLTAADRITVPLELSLSGRGGQPSQITALTVLLEGSATGDGDIIPAGRFALAASQIVAGTIDVAVMLDASGETTLSFSVSGDLPPNVAVNLIQKALRVTSLSEPPDLDVSEDGRMDTDDLILLLRFVAGRRDELSLLSGTEQVQQLLRSLISEGVVDLRLELDGNLRVDAVDLRILLRYMAGLRGSALGEDVRQQQVEELLQQSR